MSDGIPPFPPLLMKYRQSEIGSFFLKSVLDTQNVVYIKNVQTRLLEVKNSERRGQGGQGKAKIAQKRGHLTQKPPKIRR